MNASLVFDNHRGRKVYQVHSPTDNRLLQVTTEVHRNGVLQAKVWQYDYDYKQQFNKRGNAPSDFGKGIDYKALNALRQRAKDAGLVLSLCNSYQAALRLLRFGGELVQIRNLGKGVKWGTLR